MADNTLIKTLKEMTEHSKKIEFYKTRPKIKGKIIEKKTTTKGNIKLTIQKGNKQISFIVLKNHKERYPIAEKLKVGNTVYAMGIRKSMINICTQLQPQMKETDNLMQTRL